MTGIVIGFLIKTKSKGNCQIFYSHPFDIHELRENKIKFIAETLFQSVPFDHIVPDKKNNWINQTDNNFDDFLPLVNRELKAGRYGEAIFRHFSRGVETGRDEWMYDLSSQFLENKLRYFIEIYQNHFNTGFILEENTDIKWDRQLKQYLKTKVQKIFSEQLIKTCLYRPYSKQYIYFDKHFNRMPGQIGKHLIADLENKAIFCTDGGTQTPFAVIATDKIPDVHLIGTSAQCLPLYRYDENGDRVENITDWALERFRDRYLPSPPAPLPQERGAISPLPSDYPITYRVVVLIG